jgi:hypothetical protein
MSADGILSAAPPVTMISPGSKRGPRSKAIMLFPSRGIDCRFLFSVLECDPEWNLIQLKHLKDMPAVRWKIQNLQKLKASNPRKFQQQAAALRDGFEK